jgi:hypothetical protein
MFQEQNRGRIVISISSVGRGGGIAQAIDYLPSKRAATNAALNK